MRLGLSVAFVFAGVSALAFEAVNHLVYVELTPPLFDPMEPVDGLTSLSAETCATCHVEIAEEWRMTGHAGASTGALYRADLAAQETTYFCDHCHAPLVEQRAMLSEGLTRVWPTLQPRLSPNPRVTPGLHAEGVTCVACHQRDGAMHGPFESAIAPHPVQQSDALSTEESCRPCHSMDLRLLGDLERPIMDTYAEWEDYKAAGGDQNCVQCHMPERPPRPAARGGAPRPGRSHKLLGPYDIDFVRQGAKVEAMTLTATRHDGAQATLTLRNETGHRLPTAEPHRKLVAALELLDDTGAVIAQSKAVMQRVMDVHSLTELPGQDSSLLPREVKEIELSLEGPFAEDAVRARLALRFVLWDPEDPVAQDAGLGAEELVMVLHEQERVLSAPPSAR